MTNEELCIACQAGETNAAEELIAVNFPFIRSVALGFERAFPGLWLDADDFTQEGALALLRAVQYFDPDAGAGFLTYAASAIRNGIRDSIRAARRNVQSTQGNVTYSDQQSGTQSQRGFASLGTASHANDPEHLYLRKELFQQLHATMQSLPKREQVWLRMRFGFDDCEPMSLAETARQFQMSISRAKRLEQQAIAHMRSSRLLEKDAN